MWIAYGSLAQGKSSHGNHPLPLMTDKCPVPFAENVTGFVDDSSQMNFTDFAADSDSVTAFLPLQTTVALETATERYICFFS